MKLSKKIIPIIICGALLCACGKSQSNVDQIDITEQEMSEELVDETIDNENKISEVEEEYAEESSTEESQVHLPSENQEEIELKIGPDNEKVQEIVQSFWELFIKGDQGCLAYVKSDSNLAEDIKEYFEDSQYLSLLKEYFSGATPTITTGWDDGDSYYSLYSMEGKQWENNSAYYLLETKLGQEGKLNTDDYEHIELDTFKEILSNLPNGILQGQMNITKDENGEYKIDTTLFYDLDLEHFDRPFYSNIDGNIEPCNLSDLEEEQQKMASACDAFNKGEYEEMFNILESIFSEKGTYEYECFMEHKDEIEWYSNLSASDKEICKNAISDYKIKYLPIKSSSYDEEPTRFLYVLQTYSGDNKNHCPYSRNLNINAEVVKKDQEYLGEAIKDIMEIMQEAYIAWGIW